MFNKFTGFEDPFAEWRRDGMPGLTAESYRYVDFPASPDDDQKLRDGRPWPHQWPSFLGVK